MADQYTADGIVLENALHHWVHRVYQASRHAMFGAFREAAGEEITPEQWIVLVRLWERDGRTQTELGESTCRDRPTMSRLLDGMERRGLLHRRGDERNRRVQRVFLSARGKALKKPLGAAARSLVKRAQRGLDDRQLEAARLALQAVFENLSAG